MKNLYKFTPIAFVSESSIISSRNFLKKVERAFTFCQSEWEEFNKFGPEKDHFVCPGEKENFKCEIELYDVGIGRGRFWNSYLLSVNIKVNGNDLIFSRSIDSLYFDEFNSLENDITISNLLKREVLSFLEESDNYQDIMKCIYKSF